MNKYIVFISTLLFCTFDNLFFYDGEWEKITRVAQDAKGQRRELFEG